ncbi:transaldolase [Nocardioides yefusunii]|uniref:Transaldolase n=1 Tax=Nocardioides yefusunii TaxID=2500546 RepID=A0ABW1R112_9ACTN|nr:transaldolase [Nocardioides yefusunii]
MTARLKALGAAGVSVWLDDLSRERLESGNLAALVADGSIVGVTTNPSIFAGAVSKGERYDAAVAAHAKAGTGVEEVVFDLTTEDVRNACDVLADVYAASEGRDGRVSIEVSPTLADDEEGTVAQALALWKSVDRPNAMIKIPATDAGLPAITRVLAEGISVNVTLIFGLDRYRQVLEAHLAGIEAAAAAGKDLSTIHSVASFFVSRVDSEVDARLEALGADVALQGKAALANARLAHQAFAEVSASERWTALAARGAQAQRPLWASTGVKNPAYPDTLYVSELVTPGTVNTMPEATLNAFADHGEVTGDTVSTLYDGAAADFAALTEAGIDLADVIHKLETEGVEKFVVSWGELLDTVQAKLDGVTIS